MSHLAEEYAKSLGCRIGVPHLSDHFYPVVHEKYITFHTNSKKVPCKHYDHWDVVFILIKDTLSTKGIKIIQVGGSDDPAYPQCDMHTLGSSFRQSFYIFRDALLHLGIDSVPMHIASAYGKKIVALFSNSYPSNASPLWSKSDDIRILSPDFSKTKPSFALTESPKRVNEIKPELIASATLDLLNISHDLGNYETLHMGQYHPNAILEVVPNFHPSQAWNPGMVINLRCDYGLLEESIHEWLAHKVNLMISKKINPSLLGSFRKNIAGVTLFLDDGNFDAEYIKILNKLNLKIVLVCKNKENLSRSRLDFFDWSVEEGKKKTKKDIDFQDKICDNTFYHSNKVLISDGKEYSSKSAWKAGVERTGNDEKIIDSPQFWEEIDHLHIYNYAKKKKDRNPKRVVS